MPKPQYSLRRTLRSLAAITATTAVLSASTLAAAQPSNPTDEEIAAADAAITGGERSVADLASLLSSTQSDINALELTMGELREAVNKTLVDLHDAQAEAEQARQAVGVAKSELDATQAELEAAQSNLDEVSRSEYRRNNARDVTALAGNTTTDDALDRQTYLRTDAEKQSAAIEELDRVRTANANKESELRRTRDLAEQREAAAAEAQSQAEAQVNENQAKIEEQARRRQELVDQQAQAAAELEAARGTAQNLQSQRSEYLAYQEAEAERKAKQEAAERAAEAARKAEAEAAQAQLQQQREEEAQRAAEQAAAAQEQAERERDAAAAASASAAAALVAASQPEHASLDNPYPTEEDAASGTIAALQGPGHSTADATDEASETPGTPSATQAPSTPSAPSTSTVAPSTSDDEDGEADTALAEIPLSELATSESVTDEASGLVSGSRDERIETAISRAMSQIGMPYAWGGGDANGPTLGIRDGGVADSFGDYNKIGFDCSGLVLYAFAGVGISLPHYTGYQYQHGTQLDPSQMQRGDLIFYGPGGSQHVAIYLGDGTMLEAPQSGSTVRISQVRYSGMSDKIVRLI